MCKNQEVNKDTLSDKISIETAVFGGGCFWCLEAVFSQIKGVIKAEPGYAGGRKTNPTYREVCAGDTGHAEVVKVEFDPEKITFKQLLDVFFSIHDPTTLNRQGNDIGNQYRSIILYTNLEQKKIAEKFMEDLNNLKIYKSPIVTEIKPLEIFYKAEDYHQEYFKNNISEPYCQIVISPKLKKIKNKFSELFDR